MSKPRSNARRFVNAAWTVLTFQLIASVGAVGVTGLAAFHVRDLVASNAIAPEPPSPATDGPTMTGEEEIAPSATESEEPVAPATSTEPAAPVTPPPTINRGAAPINIRGEAREGQSLVAVIGSDPDGGPRESSYQWLRDGQAIGGAVGSTYALGAADNGHLVSVRVNYADDNGNAEVATSAAVQPVALPPVNNGASAITIRRDDVAETLARALEQLFSGSRTQPLERLSLAAVLGADPDGAGTPPPTYQWLRDGEPISGATTATYRTEPADAGRSITVRADYVDREGFRESVVSAPVQPPRPAVEGRDTPG